MRSFFHFEKETIYIYISQQSKLNSILSRKRKDKNIELRKEKKRREKVKKAKKEMPAKRP